MCAFVLKETIDYYSSHSSPVYMCYVDASKAFDRINIWHMLKKLVLRNLPTIIVRMFLYWYTNQHFIIKWCDKLSLPFKSTNGLRQGSILSPVYFNVFMDELSQELSKTNVGCYLNDTCVNHLFYADDSVLIAPSPYALQQLLNVCEVYARNYEMCYNAKKTACMVIYPKAMKNMCPPRLYLNSKELSWVAEHKYLGIFVTSNNCDDRDIQRQVHATYCRGNVLISKFRKCTEDVKTQLFNSFCSNFYACHLWSNFHDNVYRRIRVAYNNVFRGLFKLGRKGTSQAFVMRNISCFDTIIRNCITGFKKRIYASENVLVKAAITCTFFVYGSKMTKRWNEVQY